MFLRRIASDDSSTPLSGKVSDLDMVSFNGGRALPLQHDDISIHLTSHAHALSHGLQILNPVKK